MTHCYLKIFKQSHYISWNILFLWGLGLWIALCTTSLFYQQNLNFDIAHNISTGIVIMENTLCITTTNSTLSSTASILKPVFKYIDIFAFVFLIILSMCMQEHIRKKLEVWNNIFHRRRNTASVISYLNSLMRKHKNDIFNKEIYSNAHIILQSEILMNSEIIVEEKVLHYDQTEEKCVCAEKNKNVLNAKMIIVQNKIVFNGYTSLLFSSYELYQYFNNQQLKNTYHLLTRYSAVQNLNDIKLLNEKMDNSILKKGIQKGIISSSPEFKKFLENIKRSRFFHPFMLEISTSYIICIKSIYK